jgi:hypothetical protein
MYFVILTAVSCLLTIFWISIPVVYFFFRRWELKKYSNTMYNS